MEFAALTVGQLVWLDGKQMRYMGDGTFREENPVLAKRFEPAEYGPLLTPEE